MKSSVSNGTRELKRENLAINKLISVKCHHGRVAKASKSGYSTAPPSNVIGFYDLEQFSNDYRTLLRDYDCYA